ncbi:MAG: hypothetical protein CMJ83_20910 [Planctomycetes bacterium]|nr:hypothetical protein [Planctomycetota bacterium]
MLLITLNVILVLSAMAAAFLTVAFSEHKEHVSAKETMNAFYVAEAGLNDAVFRVRNGDTAWLGSPTSPTPFNEGRFTVHAEQVADSIVIIATGTYGNQTYAIEGVVVAGSSTLFDAGGIGDVGIDLVGNNVVDSYDSESGSYLTQATRETGGQSYADSNGDLKSNGEIDLSGSAFVFGDVDAASGVSGVGVAFIDGVTAPTGDGFSLDQLELPVIAATPGLPYSMQNAETALLTSGEHRFSTVDLGGSSVLTIVGPATVVLDDLIMHDTARLEVDATVGPVMFYVTNGLDISGNAMLHSTRKQAPDVLVYADTDNYTGYENTDKGDSTKFVGLSGNGVFNGALYAPNGVVHLGGDSHVYGAVVAKKLWVDGDAALHFDELLLRKPWLPTGTSTSGTTSGTWSELESRGGTLNLKSWRRVAIGTEPPEPDDEPGEGYPPGKPLKD